tara:strand:+ start:36 stop:746 length:711 start_codon:yes stop_codon:yes gene_type:complete
MSNNNENNSNENNSNENNSNENMRIAGYRRAMARKKRMQNKRLNLTSGGGIISKSIVGIAEWLIFFIWKLIKQIFKIFFDIVEYIYDLFFGSFNGIFNGTDVVTCYSYKYLRYICTIFSPPIGIFFSKGVYGWFNILICWVITMVNFVAGIVYAFVIMRNDNYASRYERVQLAKQCKKFGNKCSYNYGQNKCVPNEGYNESDCKKPVKPWIPLIISMLIVVGIVYILSLLIKTVIK